MTMTVAILAGGLATRLKPLTEAIPKALVNVAGKPFVEHQLDLLRSKGYGRVVFCVGYLGEMVEDAIGDGTRFGMEIKYVYDGEELLGTGGALKRALPLLGDAFLVLYGDAYLDCDYRAVEDEFKDRSKLGLMTVFKNDGQWDRSNIVFTDGRIVRYDKLGHSREMRHIDYGLGALRREAFDAYPADTTLDLASVYRDLIGRGELPGFEVTKRFYEIGSPEGLEETRRYISQREGRMTYAQTHLREASEIISKLDISAIEKAAELLVELRNRRGRLFILGVGGSAANASHAVNDFRKIAGIEAYAPTDNVSELTARTNDDGWASVFVEWLKGSCLRTNDMTFVFSVGGGNLEKNISPNLVAAIKYAKEVGAGVVGVVGRDGGYTARVADACVIIPTVNPENVTPHSEAFQAVVWHLLVSHPALKARKGKWESTEP